MSKPAPAAPDTAKMGFWRKLGVFNLVFLVLAVAGGVAGYLMQRVAFPEAGSTYDAISVSVYVRYLPAHVTMQARFSPGKSTTLAVKIAVSGPTRKADPALILIQCKQAAKHPASSSVQLLSESTASPQLSGSVLAFTYVSPPPRAGRPRPRSRPGGAPSWEKKLGCETGLSSHGQKAATVIRAQDVNLTLPVLQQNPDVQSAQPHAPVYAEFAPSDPRNVSALVEVLDPASGACPAPDSGASGPPASGPPASASPPAIPSSSGTSSPPPQQAGACFTPTVPGAAVTTYRFPTTVAATETLNGVDLADDRIDSIYPPGQVGTDTIAWKGPAGLAPSLSATNLASADRKNQDAFWAGLLYGLVAAVAVPFLQGFSSSFSERRWGPTDLPGVRVVKANVQRWRKARRGVGGTDAPVV